MGLSDKTLLWIGGGVVALAVVVIKWALDRMLEQVDERLDERDKENEEDVLHSL